MKMIDQSIGHQSTPGTNSIVPDYFQQALNKNKKAETAFDALPPSHQKEYTQWIGEAKKMETRERRIEKAMAMLTEGKQWK